MNREHRLVREAHRLRLDRALAAEHPAVYDAVVETLAFQDLLGDLQKRSAIDLTTLHPAMLEAVVAIVDRLVPALDEGGLVDAVGERVAAATFTDRARSDTGRPVLGGADRAKAKGCAGIARAALLAKVVWGLRQVLRARALVDHRETPCWPDGYLEWKAARLAEEGALTPMPLFDGEGPDLGVEGPHGSSEAVVGVPAGGGAADAGAAGAHAAGSPVDA